MVCFPISFSVDFLPRAHIHKLSPQCVSSYGLSSLVLLQSYIQMHEMMCQFNFLSDFFTHSSHSKGFSTVCILLWFTKSSTSSKYSDVWDDEFSNFLFCWISSHTAHIHKVSPQYVFSHGLPSYQRKKKLSDKSDIRTSWVSFGHVTYLLIKIQCGKWKNGIYLKYYETLTLSTLSFWRGHFHSWIWTCTQMQIGVSVSNQKQNGKL